MGQDYTLYDWLQILLLLVGMPLIAASGAALGLIGRIRRGGFLPSTIAGLSGAAIASAVLYLGIWTLGLESTINPGVFLEIYENGYQRHISIACLIATFVIALLWAIRWRVLHAKHDPTPISITLRTALLMQVLSLLCVGSWCGLRAIVYNSANPRMMTKRIWESRGWQSDYGSSLTLSASGMTAGEVREALAPETLCDLSRFPAIQNINIATCDITGQSLTGLNSAPQVTSLGFTDCEVNAFFRKEIFELKQLAGITLRELTTVQPSLTNLAKFPKLESFYAENTHFEREDFRRLLANSQLQQIYLIKVDIYQPGKSFDQWPLNTKFIYISACNFTPEDLIAIGKLKSLTHLHLGDSPLNDEVLEHFQELTQLQNVSFMTKGISSKGYEIVTKKMQPPLLHIMGGELPPGVATQLAEMTKLQSLKLPHVILSDQDIEEIFKSSTIAELQITSPGLTETALLKLANMSRLRQLHYPSFKGCRTFENRFSQERIRLRLPPVQLVSGATVDANGVTTIVPP